MGEILYHNILDIQIYYLVNISNGYRGELWVELKNISHFLVSLKISFFSPSKFSFKKLSQWYGEITTKGVRFGLPCWSNISRQEHCLRFESLHKQDRSCLTWMILVDQISQGKNTWLRFESFHKQDWSCRAWIILHAT